MGVIREEIEHDSKASALWTLQNYAVPWIFTMFGATFSYGWVVSLYGKYLGVSIKLGASPIFWCSLPSLMVMVIIMARISDKYARPLIEAEERAKRELIVEKTAAAEEAKKAQFTRRAGFSGLRLGVSNGMLFSREHRGGIQSNQYIDLTPEDCCKNIWIGGGIGSGKTTSSINPILHQILQQDTGALVFNIKGDFERELRYIANKLERTYSVVGDGGKTLNLIRGTTPELAASFLKSAFMLGGQTSGDGQFFADTATNYCRNLLTLLQLSGGDYSLAGLADIALSKSRRDEAMEVLKDRFDNFNRREQRIAEAVFGYLVDVVGKWDEKFRANVIATCDPVLTPFTHPDMVDAFSCESELGEADLTNIVNNGEIFLVNLPRMKYGAQGARIAYLLIKLRFMSMMSDRRSQPDMNQDRYVAFLCDEYQAIADAIADIDFWDKSRNSRTIGIISMQGVSSLIQAVGGEKQADAILQNFRQRIVFRTEDQATIEMVQRLLGMVDVEIINESYSSAINSGGSNSWGGGGVNTGSSHGVTQTKSLSINTQQQQLFSANDFRGLDASYAILVGNVRERAVDEVIRVTPYYVP